ncbi:hypothetical protein OEZ85_012786 [Tetradesmus obliquus]|uniref:Uncharacterized protein n=1 Tax=Tetradesmus obliquus TaxID=3088 RepID=A0ABY8U3N0_TETOB|nr:hypothetical protein OEZ85_012786 [Tetradesmus obliquus]
MSYLNISQAAWSLVLSKDPRIQSKSAGPDIGSEDAGADLPPLFDSPSTLTTAAAAPQQPTTDSSSKERQHGRSGAISIVGSLQRNSIVGKPPTADKRASTMQAKPAQQQLSQQQLDDAAKAAAAAAAAAAAEEEQAGALPMVLRTGQPKHQVSAPAAWSPNSGQGPSRWLEAAHGPLWQAQAAAAARQAAAANRHVLGQLEQRRAALLKELGSARDMDFKRLLQLVSLLQQSEASKLQAARLSSAQQLEATLQLQQQAAQQQLQQETQQLQDSWSARCRIAEAAAEKQEALRAAAESECSKLRAELASAKREAASWRSRWERDCTANGGMSSSGVAGLGAAAGSSAGGLDSSIVRASSSGVTAAAFEFGYGRRASRASNTG